MMMTPVDNRAGVNFREYSLLLTAGFGCAAAGFAGVVMVSPWWWRPRGHGCPGARVGQPMRQGGLFTKEFHWSVSRSDALLPVTFLQIRTPSGPSVARHIRTTPPTLQSGGRGQGASQAGAGWGRRFDA
jgi:hypothetical protein